MPTLRMISLHDIIINLNTLYHYWEFNKDKRDFVIAKNRNDSKEVLQRKKIEAANYRLQYNIIIMYLISFVIDVIAFVYEKEIFVKRETDSRVHVHNNETIVEMKRDTFNDYLLKVYSGDDNYIDDDLYNCVKRSINSLFNVRNGIAHNIDYCKLSTNTIISSLESDICLNLYTSLLSKIDIKPKFKLEIYEMLEHVFFGNSLDVNTNAGKLFLQQKELIEKDIQRQQEGKVVESNNKSSKSDIEKLLESVSSNSAKNEVEKYIVKSIDELK